jgi:hypothetical protein
VDFVHDCELLCKRLEFALNCQASWRWCVFKATAGTSKSSKQGKVLINYGRKMAKLLAGCKFMTFVKKIGYSLARIFHQSPTATAPWHALPGFHSVRVLDVLVKYVCALFGRESQS